MAEIVSNSCEVDCSNGPQIDSDKLIFDKSRSETFKQLQDTEKNQKKGAKKPLKRKRASIEENVIGADKESLITTYRQELEELFEYYKEVSSYKLHLDEYSLLSNNSVVACLLEESSLPFSKLVDEIYGKLKARGGNWEGITLASVRSTVLFIGQRVMYGIADPDADVLEDESQLCLWCWETRDTKLLPITYRWILSIRRIGRKKIHERISALSATLSALSIPESHENYKSELLKTSEKLGKAINGMGIRLLVERLKQKNVTDMYVTEAKPKEALIKDFDPKSEKKGVDREIQKEKCQAEKELKRLQKEAEKEQKRHEKEQTELRKQHKRQKEEAQRDQRRREREEAELKKQLALQKQATIMERFLKSKKSNDCSDNSENVSPASPCKTEDLVEPMDRVISEQESLHTVEDLRKLHVASWHKARYSNRSNRWGVRRNPKVELIKELKLRGSSFGKVATPNMGCACDKVNGNGEPDMDMLVDKWEETIPNEISCQEDAYVAPTCIWLVIKKLLQFDKSPRPAYYGTCHRKSVVGPRQPFKKDPDLEYDINSDEEWEEEDPGESLSDCDGDNEEELLEEGSLNREDEDENEDSFFVPDGYLSEDEQGVRVDGPSYVMENEAKSSCCFKLQIESEEFRALLRHQKYLCTVTEQALQKNQPFVISNLMHEKAELISAVGLVGTPKFEQICLQALCMQPCPGGSNIDQSMNYNSSNKDPEICRPQSKNSSTSVVCAAIMPDSDLSEFVECIQSCPHGMSKLVDLLHCKFPSSTKSFLRNKVREISDFVNNHWQVKKEVLDKLDLSNSPDKSCRPKGTATLSSKWCLPPSEYSMDVPKSSQPCFKTEAHLVEDQHRINPGMDNSSI
ncbi:chromatin assembly factor 1 subunit FSM isoform X6 [Elaeis guineensis]|uniref:chromatin assembly factor 1 subunit FSM isoform X6 n=1 Tax=Elaeis guineensis var. tenera TaxID=51953 RepID=UPI003C6D9893